ncbi:MAG: CRISPR-associated endonuclease Cas1 [Deltaproteobacteria bacterium]|nr:CRISPR-associated endonuclease Cas1 [Deltaproteobacteria bacterium]
MNEIELVPVRMISEVAYCPRLFALEHVNGEWADSADTVEGRTVHRRVDRPTRVDLPDEDSTRPVSVRSVKLGSPALQMVAVIDLVEAQGKTAVPIDYKKGNVAPTDTGAWEPQRVQVCAQALLLREHGYEVPHGELYFAGSRRRVRVDLSDALVARTLELRDQALTILETGALPAPLEDSPKCLGCSLAPLCMPDEHYVLMGAMPEARPLVPARQDGTPLYVQLNGGKIGKSGEEIVIYSRDGEVGRARFEDTSRVVLYGNITATTPLIAALAERDIPISFHSYSGWYQSTMAPASGKNVLARIAQHRAASDEAASMAIAKAFIRAKIANSRVMLRRNAQGIGPRQLALLAEAVEEVNRAPSAEVLLGVEGNAARIYFEHFASMLKAEVGTFEFDGRNRRPPRDPVNALLSFAYAILARELTQICHGIGLDAWVGFLHQPRHGRPALALDLMEEFRPIIADSAVIQAINTRAIQEGDFQIQQTGTTLTPAGKKAFVRVVERRLDELVTHPLFGTRLSYRRVLEVQARVLAKVVLGEIPDYKGFVVR